MKTKISALLILILLFSGCANYKQLKPDPELSFKEQGYVEIKDDDELFEIEANKKYYMEFPAPKEDAMYLVLDISNKDHMNSYLTDHFDDGEGRIIEIKDESAQPNRFSVFPINSSNLKYFWVIDKVEVDKLLQVDYRYVPQWRYQFELKYNSLNSTLNDNFVDRSDYQSIGAGFDLASFDYQGKIAELENRFSNLKAVQTEWAALELVFPAKIKNSKDEAWQHYSTLGIKLEQEIAFQQEYLSVLKVLSSITGSGDIEQILNTLDEYIFFFEKKENYPPYVIDEVSGMLSRRLAEAIPFYSHKLEQLTTAAAFESKVDKIQQLYEQLDISIPSEFEALRDFITRYNTNLNSFSESKAKVTAIEKKIKLSSSMPSNTFYAEVITQMSRLKAALPQAASSQYGNYQNFKCVKSLNYQIRSLHNKIKKRTSQYKEAELLIPKLNVMKNSRDYYSMRRLIRSNEHLSFLADQYRELDQLSIHSQKQAIKNAFKIKNYSKAEATLKKLHNDNDFLNPKAIAKTKGKIVTTMEDSLFNRIENESQRNALSFLNANLNTVENIDALYENAAFTPAHPITFSSRGQNYLNKKNRSLNTYLTSLKEDQFPSKAITHLFSQFTANPQDNGVLKARAVAAHGQYYKGKDKKIRYRVAECDPWASKWITKAKRYRKVYALPINESKQSTNEYVVRFNVRIPSEAKFPVYDINIKLPKSIASQARSDQWYSQITLNKKPVKNEGRFTITAPTAANNYECQITPLRMTKDQDNVLEIRFKKPAFTIYEVSVMAQKPIIKKN
jgi:hypothetical protein